MTLKKKILEGPRPIWVRYLFILGFFYRSYPFHSRFGIIGICPALYFCSLSSRTGALSFCSTCDGDKPNREVWSPHPRIALRHAVHLSNFI